MDAVCSAEEHNVKFIVVTAIHQARIPLSYAISVACTEGNNLAPTLEHCPYYMSTEMTENLHLG